jgi:hypothetical protein
MTHGISEQEDVQTLLRTVGVTETAQENNEDWLELDEGDLSYHLSVSLQFLNKGSTVM